MPTATTLGDTPRGFNATITLSPPISVALAPASPPAIYPGQTQQFTPTLTNANGNTVVWTLNPQVGSISDSGLYVAPASSTTQQTIVVTATSWVDNTESATVNITLLPSPVLVNPVAATLNQSQTVQVAAMLNGNPSTAVTWSLNPQVGTIDNTGLYTAPASLGDPQTVTVTATNAADSTKSASATITLVSSPVIVLPGTVTLAANGSQQFTATVVDSPDSTVSWSIDGPGSIDDNGNYSAPSSIGAQQTVDITATSNDDDSIYGSGAVILTPPPPPVSVSLTCAVTSLYAGQTQSLTATVTGASNPNVTWSVSPAGTGTISATGLFTALYTAPATVTGQQVVTITVTSVADTTKSASATITLLPPIGVAMSPTSVSLRAGQTQQFTPTLTNAPSGSWVTWSLSPASGTGAIAGGLYTAPSPITSQQTVTVTATSQQDPTKSASATITLLPPVAVALSPSTVSLNPSQTQQFTATVSYTSNTAVTWSLNGCGYGCTAAISSSGLYTAPAAIPYSYNMTVTATSVADSSKSATATINLVAPITVTVSGSVPIVHASGTEQFTATVTNTTNTAVTWSINPQVGTISSTGLYTAPATVTTGQNITVTATSVADTTKSGSSFVELRPPVAVTIYPATLTLYAAQNYLFSVNVSNASDQSVTWSLSPALGTISGFYYFAPATITSQETATLTATSVEDPTKSASCTITLMPPGVVTITPAAVSLSGGGSRNFTATVSDSQTATFTWAISGAGTINASTGAYTAPPTVTTTSQVTVTATTTDAVLGTRSGTATITLERNVAAISVSPVNTPLSATQTQQFVATINGLLSGEVSWQLSPATNSGTISGSGLYTAPALVSNSQFVTVICTSVADPTKSATATVLLQPGGIQTTQSDSGGSYPLTNNPRSLSNPSPGAPGAGPTNVFTFQATAATGSDYTSLEYVSMLFSWTIDGLDSCYAIYSVTDHLIYLVNDTSSDPGAGYHPGTGDPLGTFTPPSWIDPTDPTQALWTGNSQCALDLAHTGVQGSGSNLTIYLALQFNTQSYPSYPWTNNADGTVGTAPGWFGGPQQIYMDVTDMSSDSGWGQSLGSYSTGDAAAKVNTSAWASTNYTVTPSSAGPGGYSSSAGYQSTASFTFHAKDPNWYKYIAMEEITFTDATNSSVCYLVYYRSWNLLLLNGPGWSSPMSRGQSADNGVCKVTFGDVTTTTDTPYIPNTLNTLNLMVSVQSYSQGQRYVYLRVRDHAGNTIPIPSQTSMGDGWQQVGTWIAAPAAPGPSVGSGTLGWSGVTSNGTAGVFGVTADPELSWVAARSALDSTGAPCTWLFLAPGDGNGNIYGPGGPSVTGTGLQPPIAFWALPYSGASTNPRWCVVTITVTATSAGGVSPSVYSGIQNPVTIYQGGSGSGGAVVGTDPPGLSFVVDGTTYTATQTFFNWSAGIQHSIGVTSPQTINGTRYDFSGWSDGGAQTHNVLPGIAYTASFTPASGASSLSLSTSCSSAPFQVAANNMGVCTVTAGGVGASQPVNLLATYSSGLSMYFSSSGQGGATLTGPGWTNLTVAPTAYTPNGTVTITASSSGYVTQTQTIPLQVVKPAPSVTVAITNPAPRATITAAQQFTATSNDPLGVTWSLQPGNLPQNQVGSITSSGYYTPPSSMNGQMVTVVATSRTYPSASVAADCGDGGGGGEGGGGNCSPIPNTQMYLNGQWVNTIVIVAGTSGTLVLYGTCMNNITSVGSSDPAHITITTWGANSAQVTIGYSLQDTTPTAGQHSFTLGAGGGSSIGVEFSVADPTPHLDPVTITASPDDQYVTFTGSGFGLNLTPSSLTISAVPPTVGTVQVRQILQGSPDPTTSFTATLTAPTPGNYTVTVVSSGISASMGFFSSGGSSPTASTSSPQTLAVNAAPTVAITSRPIALSPVQGSPGLYQATVTATGQPAGGTYLWSSSTAAFNGTQSSATATLQVSQTGKTTITVTYSVPSGQARDTLSFVLTPDVTVIGWINPAPLAPTVANTASVSTDTVSGLAPGFSCTNTVLGWRDAGEFSTPPGLGVPQISTDADRQWANAVLLFNSADIPNPPETVSTATLKGMTDRYRLYSRFQASYDVSHGTVENPTYQIADSQTGLTLEPCSGMASTLFSPVGEAHAGFDGVAGVSVSGTLVYFVSESRVGPDGQAVNRYLNKRILSTQTVYPSNYPSPASTLPYVWAATEFDLNGSLQPFTQGSRANTLSLMPEYWVYPDGLSHSGTTSQGDPEPFIAQDAGFYFIRP